MHAGLEGTVGARAPRRRAPRGGDRRPASRRSTTPWCRQANAGRRPCRSTLTGPAEPGSTARRRCARGRRQPRGAHLALPAELPARRMADDQRRRRLLEPADLRAVPGELRPLAVGDRLRRRHQRQPGLPARSSPRRLQAVAKHRRQPLHGGADDPRPERQRGRLRRQEPGGRGLRGIAAEPTSPPTGPDSSRPTRS